MRRRNVLTVCSKWPKDHLCKIWGKNVRSGARYGCECSVLRDGGIRVIPTYSLTIGLPDMAITSSSLTLHIPKFSSKLSEQTSFPVQIHIRAWHSQQMGSKTNNLIAMCSPLSNQPTDSSLSRCFGGHLELIRHCFRAHS